MRVNILKRAALVTVVFLAAALGAASDPVNASVIQMYSGVSSVGTPLSLQAELAINGDILTVTLQNKSTADSSAPNDLLCSYYFDIVNSESVRPTLVYESATGDVWWTQQDSPDELQTPGANLMAVNDGDDTWQFKTFDADLNPFLGFGVGTVGNSNLPNNFNGNIVGGFNYSIYVGDVATSNLVGQNGYPLVKGPVTFVFSGVGGFSEADISCSFVFGLGTAPDNTVPEPATMGLLALGGLALLLRKRKH